MAKYKVSELEGALLDAAVALAGGYTEGKPTPRLGLEVWKDASGNWMLQEDFKPSTEWKWGGPIIERERIAVLMLDNGWRAWMPTDEPPGYRTDYWLFERNEVTADGKGPTPLIAAMRAFVASKFGEEVELP